MEGQRKAGSHPVTTCEFEAPGATPGCSTEVLSSFCVLDGQRAFKTGAGQQAHSCFRRCSCWQQHKPIAATVLRSAICVNSTCHHDQKIAGIALKPEGCEGELLECCAVRRTCSLGRRGTWGSRTFCMQRLHKSKSGGRRRRRRGGERDSRRHQQVGGADLGGHRWTSALGSPLRGCRCALPKASPGESLSKG